VTRRGVLCSAGDVMLSTAATQHAAAVAAAAAAAAAFISRISAAQASGVDRRACEENTEYFCTRLVYYFSDL